MSEELRRDPEDGKVYSFGELSSFYGSKKYSKAAIKLYWNDVCIPVITKAQAKEKAKPKSQAKEAKATGKEKSKGKGKGEEKLKYVEKKPPTEATTSAKSPIPAAGTERWMALSDLCVFGEALIDFLPGTTGDGQSAFRPAFGGSPFNCCIAAHRLGLGVTFLGGLSTDMFGEQLHSHLHSGGVDVSLAPRLVNPTTLAFVSREAGGEKYAFFKENAADRSVTKAHVARAMKQKKYKAVHMSLGAVTLEHQKMAEAFQLFYTLAGKQNALRCFDPNIRANMITEKPSAYSKRVETILRSVDLAKTSEEDAEFLYGEGLVLEDLAKKWLKLGPKLVVFTLGSKGTAAFALDAKSELVRKDVKLPEQCAGGKTLSKDGSFVPVSDTVGAGDTFMGGLITGCVGSNETTLLPQLVEKKPWTARETELLEDVLRLAVTAAAMNCSRSGCDPPSCAEAQKYLVQGPFKSLKLASS